MEASGGSPNFGHQHHVGQNGPDGEPAWRSWLYIGLMIVAAAVAAYVIWWAAEETAAQQVQLEESLPQVVAEPKPSTAPELTVEVLLTGRNHIWDIGFLPDKTPIFTERAGSISALKGAAALQLAKPGDVESTGGEGGMLGLAVDTKFAENRHIYTCFNTKNGDIRVVRWKVNTAVTTLEDRKDIITGIPEISGGRHSGCRLAFGPDDYLWVGTGDAAKDNTTQSPTSLGGKILRVDRDGKAVPTGNQGGAFDPRVFSYGHRNVQGLAFFAKPVNGVVGVSIEHGSSVDDEVNPLVNGNFGWLPGNNYNELGIPLTDKTRFPDAVESLWSSGSTTIAPSGGTFLKGNKWKLWEGRLAMAVLKDKHVRLLEFNNQNKLVSQEQIFKNEFGRIRTAAMGPENNLYLTTDNSGDDKIIRVVPK